MQQDVALCVTSAWLHKSLTHTEKVQPGQQGSYKQEGYKQEGRQWCKAFLGSGARRLRAVVRSSYGGSARRLQQWYRTFMAVMQGGYRQGYRAVTGSGTGRLRQ